jgi:hypothetical protein
VPTLLWAPGATRRYWANAFGERVCLNGGLGAFAEVIAPAELTEEVLADARQLIQHLTRRSPHDQP